MANAGRVPVIESLSHRTISHCHHSRARRGSITGCTTLHNPWWHMFAGLRHTHPIRSWCVPATQTSKPHYFTTNQVDCDHGPTVTERLLRVVDYSSEEIQPSRAPRQQTRIPDCAGKSMDTIW